MTVSADLCDVFNRAAAVPPHDLEGGAFFRDEVQPVAMRATAGNILMANVDG